MFLGKTLLITGGTGSFGNAVVKRFLSTDVGEIRIFSRDEKKQDDMRHLYNDKKLKFFIGDVRDFVSIDAAMKNVDYVFSAAALKQVPSCEFYPIEAVKTNVLGTDNVLRSAIEHGVKRVVVLSTDKAVYPINAMGMSKALMEKVAVARSRYLPDKETVICCTRYGNVMASRGSVIPLFIEQIKNGSEITITNPEMTRFMMTLDSAVDLVLFAFKNGKNGDLFVQKAPATTIGMLAEVLKEMFGVHNATRVIGTRHGEKLFETLLSKEEKFRCADLGDYFRVHSDSRDLNYAQYFSDGEPDLDRVEDYTSHNTRRLTKEELRDLLMQVDLVSMELRRGSRP